MDQAAPVAQLSTANATPSDLPRVVGRPFTRETAKAAQAKSIQRRAINLLTRLDDAAEAQQPAQDDAYLAKCITRTRRQLELIESRLERAKDPLDIERLARAVSILGERERVLAGRPLPGMRKPAPFKTIRQTAIIPLE